MILRQRDQPHRREPSPKTKPIEPAEKQDQPSVDLPRALQAELRRVGCSTGTVDGNWSVASQKALDLFNKHAGMKLDAKTASTDALDAVKGKTGRICPLVCETGFRADRDRCVRITCRAGYRVNDDNECERVPEKPVAKRETPTKRDAERKAAEPAPAKQSGVIERPGQRYIGTKEVGKGCRVVVQLRAINGTYDREVEVCN